MPSDISVGALQPPVQSRIRYPSSFAGTKRRAFNSDWFNKYRWLEYSQKRDTAYCYACRRFAVSAMKSDVFTHISFNMSLENWLNMIAHILINKQCCLGLNMSKMLTEIL